MEPWIECQGSPERFSLEPARAQRTGDATHPAPLVGRCPAIRCEICGMRFEKEEAALQSFSEPACLSFGLVVTKDVTDPTDRDGVADTGSSKPPFDILADAESLVEERGSLTVEGNLPDIGNRRLEDVPLQIPL